MSKHQYALNITLRYVTHYIIYVIGFNSVSD